MGGDRRRPARARGGADRLRQDPQRVPLEPRPAADRASGRADRTKRTRVLYVSPLKALAVDVERNLRSPLTGIRHTAERLGETVPEVTVGVRSGDTAGRATGASWSPQPPDILITTPESLFLMLTSQAREALRGVETVIVDEVHAVAGTKRGAHLAVTPRAARRAARPSRPSGSG